MDQDAEVIKQQLHAKQKQALVSTLTETRELLVNLSTIAPRSAQIKTLTEVRDRIKDISGYLSKQRVSLATTAKTVGDKDQLAKVKHRLTLNRDNRELMVKMFNRFDSLIGGLKSLDYSSQDVKVLRQNAIGKLREMIEKEQAAKEFRISPIWKRFDAEKENDPEEQIKDKLYYDKMNRMSDEEKLNRMLKDAPELLKKYGKGEKDLNLLIAKKFILAREPIVPLTQPPLDYDELVTFGFKVSRLGQYPVLEDQLVLGFNSKFLKDVKEDPKLKGKNKPTDLAKMLTDQYNRQSGKNYHILGPGHAHKTGLYFWLMPERSVNLLIKSISKKIAVKKLIVQRWGFAFSHDWNSNASGSGTGF